MKKDKICFYKAKFIIIGEANVGKTNFVHRFAKGEFNKEYAITLGIDFLSHNVQIDDKLFNLELWDTAGSEKFRSISKGYYKNTVCAIIMYDITEVRSFNSVRMWIEDCKSYTNKNTDMILIGNKCDLALSRKISVEEGKNLAEENQMQFYETSALTGENVEKVFMDECTIIAKKIEEGKYNFDKEEGLKKCYTTSDMIINKRCNSNLSDMNSKNSKFKLKNKSEHIQKRKKRKCC